MNASSKRCITAFAATAVLALGLYGCGGGGGSGPITMDPVSEDVDLANVTSGFMAVAGIVQVAAGQSQDHGDVAFSCAAGGTDCRVTVEVDANGAITAMSTGGMVTAMNSDAYTARITPMEVNLAPVTEGFMAVASTVTITAGQSVDHGDIAFSCAAGSYDCTVTVEVDANGDITAMSTGGMVTAMNSDDYQNAVTPMSVDLASVTSGFMAVASTVTITAGQSVVHGDIAFSCAAGSYDCTVTVEVDANGDISATSTGGMVMAMNSDAYTARITPMAVNLAPVTAGFMAGAGTVTITAGQSVDRGDIAFSCAAGSYDCTVTVEVDANGDINATSTGGMVMAMNSDAYTDRIATMHAFVGTWVGGAPADGERYVLEITAVSADGEATGTYTYQARGGQPSVRELSPDDPNPPRIENGVLSFSWGSATFEFTETAENTLQFTYQFNADAEPFITDMNRQDADDMMPSDVPLADALADAIDLVANDSRRNSYGQHIGAGWWRVHNIGAQAAVVSGLRNQRGRWVNAIISHDDADQLQHNIAVIPTVPLQEANPWARAGRYINTQEAPEEHEGVTRSISAIPQSDHGLGSAWQVTELEADYDDGGTLSIYVATDAVPSDGSIDPFSNYTEAGHSIELTGAPALAADEDFIAAWIGDGESIDGSLDGVAGTLTCANADGCSFTDSRAPGGYENNGPGVTFTPEGGMAQPVPVGEGITVPNADYLAFGHWLYVPDDVTNWVEYDFGTFASGGDPFEVSNLAGLTGTATYAGDAVGMYYVDGLTDNPTVGSFTADVTLAADFGDGTATGSVTGEVNNFEFEDDVASSLPATVTLTSDFYSYISEGFGRNHTLDEHGVVRGESNIFDTGWYTDPPWPGGHVTGQTLANANGESWFGQWHGAFYGNGASAPDHPTGVAGHFNVSPWDDNMRVGSGLTGSFGAHRDDSQ